MSFNVSVGGNIKTQTLSAVSELSGGTQANGSGAHVGDCVINVGRDLIVNGCSRSCDCHSTTAAKLKLACAAMSDLLDEIDDSVDLHTRELILHKMQSMAKHPCFDRTLRATKVSKASASPRRGRVANDSIQMRAHDCVDKVKGIARLRRLLATGSQKKTAAMCRSSALPSTTAVPIAKRSDTHAKTKAKATGSRQRAQKRSHKSAVSSDCSALVTATGLAAPSPFAKKRPKTVTSSTRERMDDTGDEHSEGGKRKKGKVKKRKGEDVTTRGSIGSVPDEFKGESEKEGRQ